jgi:putative phosphoribosyl transferase
MRAALAALRQQHPTRIVVAVPVGAAEACAELQGIADEMVCMQTPEPFRAVGLWYLNFGQTTDAEVTDFLAQSALRSPPT